MKIEKTQLIKVLKMEGEGLVIDCIDEKDLSDILDFFVEQGILKNKEVFKKAYLFNEQGRKRALLKFEDIRSWDDICHLGKLAMWRIQTRELLGGIWLSDFKEFERDLDE